MDNLTMNLPKRRNSLLLPNEKQKDEDFSTKLTSIRDQTEKDIGFLDEVDFIIKYPFDEDDKITQGSYGGIYSVKDNPNVIIKKGNLSGILKDIDILSQILL
jgi:hypothetical protein